MDIHIVILIVMIVIGLIIYIKMVANALKKEYIEDEVDYGNPDEHHLSTLKRSYIIRGTKWTH